MAEPIYGVKNDLLAYDNPTYNFTLLMVSQIAGKEIQASGVYTPNVHDEFVIAQSGGTQRFSIDETKIHFLAPGNKSKNTNVQSMEMNIIEAGSMAFFDAMLSAAGLLGYKGLPEAVLVVLLNFKGFDTKTGEPVTIPDASFTWTMRIKDIQAAPTSVGGDVLRYKIQLYPFAMMQDSKYLNLGGVTDFSTANTVGDAMDVFKQTLNASFKDAYPNLSGIMGTEEVFNIIVDPKLKDLTMKGSSDGVGVYNLQNQTKFTFDDGATIPSAINELFSFVENDDDDKKSAGMTSRVFVNVIPKARYAGYDPVNRCSVYFFDIYLIRYETFDVSSYNNGHDKVNIDEFTRKYSLKASNPHIKQYFYSNTGLNRELISFKYDFNTAYREFYSKNASSLVDTTGKNDVARTQVEPEPHQEDEQLDKASSNVDSEEASTLGRQYLETLVSNPESVPVVTFRTEAKDTGKAIASSNTLDTQTIARHDQSHNYFSQQFLVKAELTVVGDPYWLGYTDSDFFNLLDNDETPDVPRSDFYRQESCLQLNLRSAPVNTSDNMLKINKSSLNGSIYRVTKILSTFKQGVFTQKLDCIVIKATMNQA